MSVSSMCDYDMARPSWDHHSTSGLGAASPRASTVVSHCLGHHPARCTRVPSLPLFAFSRGKSPTGTWRTAGCSCCLWVLSGNGPCGTGLRHCLSASAQMQQKPGQVNLLRMQNSKKIFQIVFPSFPAPPPQSGESPYSTQTQSTLLSV